MARIWGVTKDVEKRAAGDHTLVDLFAKLEAAVSNGHALRSISVEDLEYAHAEFRRRCRELDRWRKRERCELTGNNKKAQRSLRLCIGSGFRSLILSRQVADAELSKGYRQVWRDNVERVAAVLLIAHHRRAVYDGGLTQKVAAAWQDRALN
jgi:hypothetical protein